MVFQPVIRTEKLLRALRIRFLEIIKEEEVHRLSFKFHCIKYKRKHK